MIKKILQKKSILISGIVVCIVGGVIALTSLFTYVYDISNVLTRTVERFVPMPAAVIGWTHIVPIADLQRNVVATRRFYENQDFASIGIRVDFTTEEGQKKLQLWEQTLLDKLIEDEIVFILAKRAGITITSEQVHARVKQELDRNGKGRIAQKNIYNLWGFTLKDFEERIVKPQLYREALGQYAQKQYDVTALRKKALEAHVALSSGMEFTTAVEQYSDGANIDATGDAGWFSYIDLTPEIAEKVFALRIGEYSEVIETDNGFHIVKVEDMRTGTLGKQVYLRHITIFKPSFGQWLDEQMKAFRVWIPLSAYEWNAQTRHVDLVDPDLVEYVDELTNETTAKVESDAEALQEIVESVQVEE